MKKVKGAGARNHSTQSTEDNLKILLRILTPLLKFVPLYILVTGHYMP